MEPVKSQLEEDLLPVWGTVSSKERQLSEVLLDRTDGKVREVLELLLTDEELHQYQSYANVVSVRRLGYNDHGPVHMRIVTYIALKILRLLHERGIKTSLELDQVADYEASQVAVALGAFLHDIGMGVAREAHEWHAVNLVDGFIQRFLAKLYPEGSPLRVVLRAMTHEVIVGHMANVRIHSVEAGTVLVADGCDMAKGRARAPQALERDPVVGDMHRYSASAIRRVDVVPGKNKPVAIDVTMDNVTGLYQVEEVLMTKVKASPIMSQFEVSATIGEDPPRYYLS